MMQWPPPPDWPQQEHSRQIPSGAIKWHVQDMGGPDAGSGDIVLFLHGTGGSTHSWRDLLPEVAKNTRAIAVDLPGQGFTHTTATRRFGLDAMAEDIAQLCAQEGWRVRTIVGHSAGAAIALRLSELQALSPGGRVVGINAALGQFTGLAGVFFPAAARLMALTPLLASAIAHTANETTIKHLLDSTGSTIDAAGMQAYLRLFSCSDHVYATVCMMAEWELEGLLSRLPSIATPTTLIYATNDKTVPIVTSIHAASLLPNAKGIELTDAGHLAPEEKPAEIAKLILDRPS